LAGKKLASWIGRATPWTPRIGLFVHRSPGAAYGMAAAASVRTGAPPIRVGIVTGAAAFVAVDEGVNSAFFTPPPRAYPAERHLRGVVGAMRP
jgi:hypothetical protein